MQALLRIVRSPIDRVRSKLREIDYYSARRSRTRWTKLSDLWIVASLPVSFLLVLLTGLLVVRHESRILAHGTLEQTRFGEVVAVLVPPGRSVPSMGRFIAAIDLVQNRRSASWPVALWNEDDPPHLLVFDGSNARIVPLRSDAPEAAAARQSLMRGDPDLRDAATFSGSRDVHFLTWIGAISIAWVALLPLGLLALQGLRGLGALAQRGRRAREIRFRRQQRCVRCGYDLHGSDFSAKCPECGAALS